MDRQIEQLKEFLDTSKSTVAITGAGISFAAGGLSFDDAPAEDMQELMALGSEDVLINDPERYCRVAYKAFLHSMFVVGPSLAHKALAQLEAQGKLTGIITTNVDCLHTIAGSKNVAEIQGSFQVNKCMECGRHYDTYEIWAHGKVPECTVCGGKIWTFPFYSHIGLYQEKVKEARKMLSKAELILIIGANGSYAGAYWRHRNKRARIVQINPGETYFDRVATMNIRKGSDDVFAELMGEELNADNPSAQLPTNESATNETDAQLPQSEATINEFPSDASSNQ